MNALREIRLRKYEPEDNAAVKVVLELDRIGRDREQIRHGSGKGFKYVVAVKKLNDASFAAELGGPDTKANRRTLPIYVKFRVGLDLNGENKIAIVDKDLATTYEQAMHLAKHSVSKILRDLPKKPFDFPDGIDKSGWSGFYLSYSGKDKKVWDSFDDEFDKAVAANYFPEEMREPLREMGFNIKEVRPTKKKFRLKDYSKKKFLRDQLV